MPRVCTICTHDRSRDINTALVNRQPYRRIAAQFSVSEAAARRHAKEHLPQLLAQAKDAEEVADADAVLAQLRDVARRTNLLFDACDEWLRDSEDPTRYNIGPRAEELVVHYEERIGGRPVRMRATLAELLERVEGGDTRRAATLVETKHADPRELVLKTAGRLQGQTELLARLIGELDNRPQVNLYMSQEWIQLRAIIITALEPHAAARDDVVRALRGAAIVGLSDDLKRSLGSVAFLSSLTDEELEWIAWPAEEAMRRVACPLHGPRCDCSNEQRQRRGVEQYPELFAEYERRSAQAYERYLQKGSAV